MDVRATLTGHALRVLAIGSDGALTRPHDPPLARIGPAEHPLRLRSLPSVELAVLDLDDDVDLVLVEEDALAGPTALGDLVQAAGAVPVVVLSDDASWQRRFDGVSAGAADVLHRAVLDDREVLSRVLGQLAERAILRRELEIARDVAGHERELRRLLASQPTMTVSANAMGQGPLSERAGQLWPRLVDEYARILDLAVESVHYRVDADPSADLRSLADLLASTFATPADVMELHRTVVGRLTAGVEGRQRIELLGEVRVRVLELMGALASRYRASSVDRPRTGSRPGEH